MTTSTSATSAISPAAPLHARRRRLRRSRQPLGAGEHHLTYERVCADGRHAGAVDADRPDGPARRQRRSRSPGLRRRTTSASAATGSTATAVAGSTSRRATTFTGLACGTSYTLAVDAYDAAGNRSAKASITARPALRAACGHEATDHADGLSARLRRRPRHASRGPLRPTTSASPATACTTATRPPAARPARPTPSRARVRHDVHARGGGLRRRRQPLDEGQHRGFHHACRLPADTQAPTRPAGWARPARPATSITVAWTASTDNVGVTGYGLYRNGASTGTTTVHELDLQRLTCGTSYTLAVDAFDAAGNRSAEATSAPRPAPARRRRTRRRPRTPSWLTRPARRRPRSRSPGPRRPTTSASPATASTATAPRRERRPRTARRSPVSPAAPRTRSRSTLTTPPATAPRGEHRRLDERVCGHAGPDHAGRTHATTARRPRFRSPGRRRRTTSALPVTGSTAMAPDRYDDLHERNVQRPRVRDGLYARGRRFRRRREPLDEGEHLGLD